MGKSRSGASADQVWRITAGSTRLPASPPPTAICACVGIENLHNSPRPSIFHTLIKHPKCLQCEGQQLRLLVLRQIYL